jgi:hypothetical protein
VTVHAARYDAVRPDMRPGDLVAFQGTSFFSQAIKLRTHSPVTHVGAVHQLLPGFNLFRRRIQLVESTSLYKVVGVQATYLSDHLANYSGRIWWMPLSDEARDCLNLDAYLRFAEETIGRPYDFAGALGSAIDWVDALGLENTRDYDAMFCSEWVSAAWQAGGLLPHIINPSEMTPQNVCEFGLYRGAYQLKGEVTQIPRLNEREVLCA